MTKIKVLIADDHLVLRLGLRILVEGQTDMELCGEASNGVEAVSLYRETTPDVLLMDIRMPQVGGIQAIRILRNELPDARILVLSSYASEEEIFQAMHAGAKGYILKESGREEILTAIRAVFDGKICLPPAIADRLTNRDPDLQLTSRETDVLRLMVKGLTNREIASVLSMSENTVKTHVKSVFKKLEVSDRAEAVSSALQRGIISFEI